MGQRTHNYGREWWFQGILAFGIIGGSVGDCQVLWASKRTIFHPRIFVTLVSRSTTLTLLVPPQTNFFKNVTKSYILIPMDWFNDLFRHFLEVLFEKMLLSVKKIKKNNIDWLFSYLQLAEQKNDKYKLIWKIAMLKYICFLVIVYN